jgi:hypothetical protein
MEHGHVSINATQHFAGVPRAAWELTVGGYQVAKKWLLDRRGRCLNPHELDCYQQIIACLARTAEIMAEIDRSIEVHEGWPIW